jgi:4-alpha-glucanotransferase
MIVGEDLGTVPPSFRERLARARLFSTRLLFFEREADGGFTDARAYPRYAVASVGTHDLPPLAGWWTGHDIDVRASIGLLSVKAATQERVARAATRRKFVTALERSGVFDPARLATLREAVASGTIPPEGLLNEAACLFLARAPALVVLLALDDLLSETEQINVPGTVAQHPNWRLRSRMQIEELAADPVFARLAEHLSKTREEVHV